MAKRTPTPLPKTTDTVPLARAALGNWSVAPMLADALMDAGYEDPDVLRELRQDELSRWSPVRPLIEALTIEPVLMGGSWDYVFAYAGEPNTGGDGTAKVQAVPPGSDVPTTPFSRWDVAELKAADEGENDEKNWVCYGRLRDGRWFFLTAGCDYTGWG